MASMMPGGIIPGGMFGGLGCDVTRPADHLDAGPSSGETGAGGGRGEDRRRRGEVELELLTKRGQRRLGQLDAVAVREPVPRGDGLEVALGEGDDRVENAEQRERELPLVHRSTHV